MRKKVISLLLLMMLIMACTACEVSVSSNKPEGNAKTGLPGNEAIEAEEKDAQEENEAENTETEINPSSEPVEDQIEEMTDNEASADGLFEDMARYEYTFSSGVGGWGTELSVSSDGSFTGNFNDSDMGSTGEGYPNGTMYYCNFKGRFSSPVFVDEYTYTTGVEEISFSEEPETEEIASDGIRYVAASAYGLDDAKTIYIYKPGKPVNELPEGYIWWVNAPTGGSLEEDGSDALEFYGIYNENADCGFISNQVKFDREDLLRIYEKDFEKQKEIDAKFEKGDLDQFSLNMLSYDEFHMWDGLLNDLWSYLKETLPEDEMTTLTEEQRAWIKQKEEAVSKETAGFEGGSMIPMIENGTAARLTRERVSYLLEKYNAE